MAELQPPAQALPSIPSPLNPEVQSRPSQTPAPVREQREKKESLKKRESNPKGGRADTPSTSTLGKRKANTQHAYPSPQRFAIPEAQGRDFAPPQEDKLASHEPLPFVCPDGMTELFKPVDLAENKKGYRYQRCIADPLFPHKQYYRSTSPPPHQGRLSFEDADRWMHFTTNALLATNEKGWRMARANVCAREGTLYYEVRMVRGVPSENAPSTPREPSGPQPHVRVGWARREAPLDAPVGFDGYSYGITDIRFETMHRSRPGKFFHPKPKPKSKAAKPAPPQPITLPEEDAHLREGDVLGLEITLPSLSLHQKIVSGVYNPAVDIGDGFDQPNPTNEPGAETTDIIRDRIPVPYKGNSYFEIIDHVPSKPMEQYADRTLSLSTLGQPAPSTTNQSIKVAPNPNHPEPSLRTLPHSSIRVYKNGRAIGTAFENLLAFLPSASAPSRVMGAREGFDDGTVGYFPAVSCFHGGIAEMNFGDGEGGFWAPPAHLTNTQDAAPRALAVGSDVEMSGMGVDASGAKRGWNPGRTCRPIGERYKEQVAEDVVWDVVDEVDFFVQDGGYGGKVGQGASEARTEGRRGRLKEEAD